MKHLISILLVASIVIVSSLAAALPQSHQASITNTQTKTFTAPVFTLSSTGTSLTIPGTNAYINDPGYPVVPSYRLEYTLPFMATIQSITVNYGTTTTYQLSQPLTIASTPAPLDGSQVTPTTAQPITTPTYPATTYDISTGAGLNGQTETNYLTIFTYPCHYNPNTLQITLSSSVTVTVTYTPPQNPKTFGDTKDLLIIAPKKFSSALQPLITFKESKGIRTTLLTVEDITSTYNGRDAPEKIKYAIKDMRETTGIKYVLLVGGIKNFVNGKPRDDANQGTKNF